MFVEDASLVIKDLWQPYGGGSKFEVSSIFNYHTQ